MTSPSARVLRMSHVQPDGRAIVRKKWLVDKTQGPVVVLAERIIKAMIRRRWPCEWVRADGELDPLRLLGHPAAVRFVCLSASYDEQAFRALLEVTVSAVALLEGRAVQDAIGFDDDGVLTADGCSLDHRGQLRPAGAKRRPARRKRAAL